MAESITLHESTEMHIRTFLDYLRDNPIEAIYCPEDDERQPDFVRFFKLIPLNNKKVKHIELYYVECDKALLDLFGSAKKLCKRFNTKMILKCPYYYRRAYTNSRNNTFSTQTHYPNAQIDTVNDYRYSYSDTILSIQESMKLRFKYECSFSGKDADK